MLASGEHSWTVQAMNATTAGPVSVPMTFAVADDVPTTRCGEIGGTHCSRSGACPEGFSSLGLTSDCNPCCFEGAATQCELLGGQYCSELATCPAGYLSLGSTFDCRTCCQEIPSCGAMGGDYCGSGGACPEGFDSLGTSYDCDPCCRTAACVSTGCPSGSCGWQTDNCGEQLWCGDCAPSCGAMGGDYCGAGGSCPPGFDSLGDSYDCNPCCRTAACQSSGCPPGSCGEGIWCGDCAPSCGEMGGEYCSQSGGCPEGFDSIGPSSDCNPCCVSIHADVQE
jgi:hypothetical protein